MNKSFINQVLLTFIPGIVILLIALVAKLFLHVSFYEITCDVATYANISPLAGVLSTLGIFLWCATAAILLFSSFNLYRSESKIEFRFLLFSALLTAWLLIDDQFEFHEHFAKKYLGISEDVVYLILAIVVLFYLISFFRLIKSTKNSIFLLFALGFLGFSVVSDTTPLEPITNFLGDWQYLLEEGTKFLGIVCWSSYFISTAYRYQTANLTKTKTEV